MTKQLPRLIALCGHPKSGKSLVQEFLREQGWDPVDDGYPLRHFASTHLGLTWPQVSTQPGKLETVSVAGAQWQVREVLGELGNALELKFGKNIMPFMALQSTKPDKRYSFGSVRRDQAEIYKAQGGLVLGIRNPMAPPSPFEFDRFDESLVDIWIENDALARGLAINDAKFDLFDKVALAVGIK